MAGVFQRLDSRAARAGGVAVGHDLNRYIGLLLALLRHAIANLIDKPALEFFTGFDGAAADDQRVGIEGIDHFIEQQSGRVRLHAKDLARHGIALLREAAYQFGGLMQVAELAEFVSRILRQEIRQERLFDGSERTDRFQIADASAVALRDHALDAANALVGNQDVAQFAPESLAALHDIAIDDDAAAEACADDDGY